MTVILSPDGRCASTFIVPGDDVSKLRRCEGKFNHEGMHGSTEHGSAAWGDGAAYDHHPGEPLTIRLRVLVEGVRRLQSQVAEQAAVIADRDATIARLTAELAEGLIDHERERDNASSVFGSRVAAQMTAELAREGSTRHGNYSSPA